MKDKTVKNVVWGEYLWEWGSMSEGDERLWMMEIEQGNLLHLLQVGCRVGCGWDDLTKLQCTV
jgi:hypothetical protein